MAMLELRNNLTMMTQFTYTIKNNQKIFPYCPIDRAVPISVLGILAEEGFKLRQNILFDYQAGKGLAKYFSKISLKSNFLHFSYPCEHCSSRRRSSARSEGCHYDIQGWPTGSNWCHRMWYLYKWKQGSVRPQGCLWWVGHHQRKSAAPQSPPQAQPPHLDSWEELTLLQ